MYIALGHLARAQDAAGVGCTRGIHEKCRLVTMQGSRWVANYYKQEGISTTSRPPPSSMPQKVDVDYLKCP